MFTSDHHNKKPLRVKTVNKKKKERKAGKYREVHLNQYAGRVFT